VNFEKGLIRDGVVIKKDGLIRTNKGVLLDKSLLVDESDPQNLLSKAHELQAEAIMKLKNPELDLIAAHKRTGAYKRNHNNIFFEKYQSRDKNPEGSKVPGFMQYRAQRHSLNTVTDKTLQMNKFMENNRFKLATSSFTNPTQSQISRQRHKQMLKNRLN
jgi:hypothetical protein